MTEYVSSRSWGLIRMTEDSTRLKHVFDSLLVQVSFPPDWQRGNSSKVDHLDLPFRTPKPCPIQLNRSVVQDWRGRRGRVSRSTCNWICLSSSHRGYTVQRSTTWCVCDKAGSSTSSPSYHYELWCVPTWPSLGSTHLPVGRRFPVGPGKRTGSKDST